MNFESVGDNSYKIELFFDYELLLSEASLVSNAFGSLWKSKIEESKKGRRGSKWWSEDLTARILDGDLRAIHGSVIRGLTEFGDKDSKPENFDESHYPKTDRPIASLETGDEGVRLIYDALIAHRDHTDLDMHKSDMVPFARISEGALADRMAQQIAGDVPEVARAATNRNIGFN